jgi:A/G-specific adenine glycosylase
VTKIAALATQWYARNARDLPWREPDTSAWAILVSEFMLQQTPVTRVLPVWHEWTRRWPEPADLAADTAADAIRAWGRLGYPRRAMRLHACAVAIVERHDGVVPDQVAQLLALPGVGTYTAHAVAAFAYRQRHPVVDTNVRRVTARAVRGAADAGPATSIADLQLVERRQVTAMPRVSTDDRMPLAHHRLAVAVTAEPTPSGVRGDRTPDSRRAARGVA